MLFFKAAHSQASVLCLYPYLGLQLILCKNLYPSKKGKPVKFCMADPTSLPRTSLLGDWSLLLW